MIIYNKWRQVFKPVPVFFGSLFGCFFDFFSGGEIVDVV